MNRWVAGARPRTLPAAVVPVAVGAGAAVGVGGVVWWRAAVALVVSLALQVGVNYANDYSDGVRGTDDVRVGPVRLVGIGLAEPPGGEAGGVARVRRGRRGRAGARPRRPGWLLVVGAAAIAAAWFYTGGPRPYGYLGLGELFVFVFFGLVATVGSTYVAVERAHRAGRRMGCAAGCLACALLVVNNLRDIPADTVAGKRTLAVRLGDQRTRLLYQRSCRRFVLAVVAGVGLAAGRPARARRRLLAVPGATVLGGARGPALIAVLGDTGRVQLVFGLLARSASPSAADRRAPVWARKPPLGGHRPDSPGHDRARSGGRCGQPGGEGSANASGCSRCAAWPASAIDGARRPGTAPGHASADRDELRVALAGEDQDRHRQLAEALPQRTWAPVPARRRLADSPAAVLRRRSATSARGRAAAGEQRLGQPAVEEGVDAVALDARRRALVAARRAARSASSSMPGGGARPARAARPSGRASGAVQAEPPADRVADVRRRPDGVDEHVRARGAGRPRRSPTAVARERRRRRLVASRRCARRPAHDARSG